MRISIQSLVYLLILSIVIPDAAHAQQLTGYSYSGSFHPVENAVRSETQFNGYTNYWHDEFKEWFRYGNLFKISVPNVASSIMQSKIDVAEDMQLPGLQLQEGFMNGLLAASCKMLEYPSARDLADGAAAGNILVITDPLSETGKKLLETYKPDSSWRHRLKSHQLNSVGFRDIDAFFLENGSRKIFVLSSTDSLSLSRLKQVIEKTQSILSDCDLKKGWFGAETLLKSVTCGQGHPLEIISKGMNEGNTWFTFSGYMEFLAKDELAEWIGKVKLPIVADVGFAPIFGCKDYAGLQVQDMATKQAWIDFAHKKQGYVFRPVYDPESDPYHYDGYLASEGNKEQVDNEDVPFVSTTGALQDDLLTSMVLFTKKGEPFSKEKMWNAIMNRHAVTVMGGGKMMGPASYRFALELLLLDRVFLEEYFGDRVDMQSDVEGYTLRINVSNTYAHPVSGKLEIVLPPELKLAQPIPEQVSLPANSSKTILLSLSPSGDAMNRTNPVAVYFQFGEHKKMNLAMLDLPPAISVHRLLYAHAPSVSYPVTIHNFTTASTFPVEVRVFEKSNPAKPVFTASQTASVSQGSFQNLVFNLALGRGSYRVKVSALGLSYESQLGVGTNEGNAYAYPVDLNSDGVNEYRLENDSVQVTLLATGARVIEYIVKSRKDNILFKLWPEKASDDKRAFRKRGYYPYGGFEDFLGQGSMETHKLYDAQIIKSKGDFVQVKMTADYFGNKLEKTFTLYGNSPLLEIRFALTFRNPEANVIGPQPILELGNAHGTEDVFTIPAMEGIQQMRMRPEEYFGHIFNLKEGWNAGYDTKQDITFVGAYPVDQPLFLHVWMNHPRNGDAHYYYTEFQPWTPIFQKSTMYFSYYIWGAGGPWEDGLKELRKRNLITER